MNAFTGGEYARRGDYHRDPDPSWSYYPLYVRKMKWVSGYIESNVPTGSRILDVGCGEGILVEKYAAAGYRIYGVDLNYGSAYVQMADIFHLPFAAATFQCLLCLDVMEHLDLLHQHSALEEMARVTEPGGRLLLTVPNLAHLHSRLLFLFRGRLARTAAISKHPGDRPIHEFIQMLAAAGFQLVVRRGMKMTLPPRLERWLGSSLAERIMFSDSAPPALCFLNVLVAEKQVES